MPVRRIHRAALLAVSLVLIVAANSAAAVSWGGVKTVGAKGTFAYYGGHLASTVSGSTRYLHQVMIQDQFNGTFASDTGTHVAVVYQRLTASGAKSGAASRLNPSGQHGTSAAIATAGPNVYVVWRTISSFTHYSDANPRLLRFRRNTNHGSGPWKPILNLTTSGRVDIPAVAATGTHVYVTYVNADTGDVHLLVSNNSGASFGRDTIIHSAGLHDSTGYYADASIAASGSMLAYTSEASPGTIHAWVSTNYGVSFPSFAHLTTHAGSFPTAAASGSRAAFGVSDNGVAHVWTWKSGTFSAARTVPLGSTYHGSAFVSVALTGTAALGVAVSACRLTNCVQSTSKGKDMVWRESKTNGTSWTSLKLLRSSVGTTPAADAHRSNNYGSAVMQEKYRAVSWTSFNGADTVYQVSVRVGTGAP
jgi:hypothetical protein